MGSTENSEILLKYPTFGVVFLITHFYGQTNEKPRISVHRSIGTKNLINFVKRFKNRRNQKESFKNMLENLKDLIFDGPLW